MDKTPPSPTPYLSRTGNDDPENESEQDGSETYRSRRELSVIDERERSVVMDTGDQAGDAEDVDRSSS
jgi:hypothetical protein